MTASPRMHHRDAKIADGPITRRKVRAIKVYWPVSHSTLARVSAGDLGALRSDDSFGAFIDVLESSSCVGDFGVYRDVYEVGLGAEGFTTRSGATPALGAIGERTLSPTLTVTVHVDHSVPEDEISQVLGQILAAHPWEVPVLELTAPFDLITAG